MTDVLVVHVSRDEPTKEHDGLIRQYWSHFDRACSFPSSAKQASLTVHCFRHQIPSNLRNSILSIKGSISFIFGSRQPARPFWGVQKSCFFHWLAISEQHLSERMGRCEQHTYCVPVHRVHMHSCVRWVYAFGVCVAFYALRLAFRSCTHSLWGASADLNTIPLSYAFGFLHPPARPLW